MTIIQKYIALHTEYEENINWSCGFRIGNLEEMDCPNCYTYVTMWTDDGNRHTILGNNIEAMQKRCYDEFLAGERNNIMPVSYRKKESWIKKIL